VIVRVSGLAAVLSLLIAASASAHTSDVLAEYGTPAIDGVISGNEYDDGCVGPVNQAANGVSYQITVCEQNTEQADFWAVKISDLTNDVGQNADSPLIWFDNDHSGTVTMSGSGCTYTQPDEDQIGFEADVFVDGFYCMAPEGFTTGLDLKFPFDGTGARKFTAGQGSTFEFSHPLDTGDVDDYSLAPHSTVGWCLTYDDHSNTPPLNPGFAFGEIQYPAGCFVDFSTMNLGLVRANSTLLGDVYKQNALDEALEKVKEKLKGLVAVCKRCPPDPTGKLKAKINEVIRDLSKQQQGPALAALKGFKKLTVGFLTDGDLPAGKARLFLKAAKSPTKLVKHFKNPKGVATSTIAGGIHTHQFRVAPNGAGAPGAAGP
jgi:hypothetical protein